MPPQKDAPMSSGMKAALKKEEALSRSARHQRSQQRAGAVCATGRLQHCPEPPTLVAALGHPKP